MKAMYEFVAANRVFPRANMVRLYIIAITL